jgi:hypothetical protein
VRRRGLVLTDVQRGQLFFLKKADMCMDLCGPMKNPSRETYEGALAYFSNLKMEATCSSKMSVYFHQTI